MSPRAYLSAAIVIIITWSLLVAIANTADIGCGRDTDRSGAVDVACSLVDADFDGYNSVADGGTDCDDTNWTIYPGIVTDSGCGANEYRTCQAGGTYTACAATSGYTCHSGSGATYWVDEAQTDCTGTGTYASPEDYRCWFNTAMTGYHAPVAGDCIVFQAGTYTASWSSSPVRQIYVSTISGTAANPIRLRGEPGLAVVLTGAGTSPNHVRPIQLTMSDYWTIDFGSDGQKPGLEIDGNFAGDGILIDGAHNATIRNVYVRDTDGNFGTDNIGGIKIQSSANNATISHVHLKNNGGTGGLTNRNNTQMDIFRGNGHNIEYSTLEATSATGSLFFYKHGDPGAIDWTFKGNILNGGSYACLDASQGGAAISRNLLLSCGGIAMNFEGGHGRTYFESNSVIEFNTINQDFPIHLFTKETYEQSSTFGTVTIRKNIFRDDRASSYSADGSTGFIRICHYCSDAIYTNLITGGKISINQNCEYNSNAVALFYSEMAATSSDDPAAGNTGTSYANFAAWQAAGYDTSSYSENPSLDSTYRATSANCTNWGWRTPADAPVVTYNWGSHPAILAQ